MELKWEILTNWKINLETEDDGFAYFNTESFIPGQIYRIHRSTGLPVIVEFQKLGYQYNRKMTETYPRVLICNETADVSIDEITTICVHSVDDEDVSSVSTESTKTVDVYGFKDFAVNESSYHVNEKIRSIQTVSLLSSDKINISGELKITGFGKAMDDSKCLCAQGICIELPTGDEIFISASDHPWIRSDKYNYPVFIINDKLELRWNKDLVAGEFYIMLNRFGEKMLILIKSIYNEKIEYESYNSKYNEDTCKYFVKSVEHELMIVYAKDHKFISLKDLMC